MSHFALLNSTSHLPNASFPDDVHTIQERLRAIADTHVDNSDSLLLLLNNNNGAALISAIAGNSPFLAKLIEIQWCFFTTLCKNGMDNTFESILTELRATELENCSQDEMMRALRIAKQRIALLIATADITGQWGVMTVTKHLTDFADCCVQIATDFLLTKAAMRGEFELTDHASPQAGSGLLILGMGKLGAFELNYSSDIDLIILYDREHAPYRGQKNIQLFFTHFAQDLTTLLHERTSDGYVFRTDLRLRPDPRSTSPAVNLHTAISYYETLGQNWERAAMIKARQIAGDPETGALFQRHIIPYIWRKHLDFHTIADIHSIKRQMNTKTKAQITLEGHNVKLGRGGIREIEFYVQTQQLIWGGRHPDLRTKATLETLKKLAALDIITTETRDSLSESYLYLRRTEHYLQMIRDQQTHSLPDTPEELSRIATFLGYDNQQAFADELLAHCHKVHTIYSKSVEGSSPLSIDGNLVFTGVDSDPDTLITLEKMGYKNVHIISDTIQDWHRGSRRATRSLIARQLLTELMPTILTALANTAKPDSAFSRFDDFLAKLPAGIQIFSMFSNHPRLLDLLANILGSAPALAEILGKHPILLDSVLTSDFYEPLPDRNALYEQISHQLKFIQSYEGALHYLRGFKNERHFQAGVHLLKGISSPQQVALFLSDLAEAITEHVVKLVQAEFSASYGEVENSAFAIIALGKLGSRELTFESDLDLIFVYDAKDTNASSDGDKSVDVRTYYNRFCARLVTAFTMLAKEGILYEIDTRLRPSGADSLIATPYEGFHSYFKKSAWVFEFMALTKARVICSTTPDFTQKLTHSIHYHLQQIRDTKELIEAILDMRQKMAATHATMNPWHIKHVRGGSVDLDFIAQYFVLQHAHNYSELLQTNSADIFVAAKDANLIPHDDADQLIANHETLSTLLSMLRLCSHGEIDEHQAPVGLKELLVKRLGKQNFDELRDELIVTETSTLSYFDKFLCVDV